MVGKPVVFISSTSDLRSARELVGNVLYSMGYEPVWQDIEATDGGELLAILRKRIDPCALVVQLVGDRYGAEPPAPTADFGRVSYTQYESLYAEQFGKKVIYQFVAPDFPTDPANPEPDELRNLQSAYRQRIRQTNRLRHDSATTQDLELSIRRISNELAALRTQADRRFRRMLAIGGAGTLGILAVATLVLVIMHRQTKAERQASVQSSQVTDQLASLRQELTAALAPKPLAQGQTAPPPLSPDLIAKAQILLNRGNAEDQALAKIALKQYADANRIIQDLKSKPNNPIDEAFRLLTMEGDNWYQSGNPDKAIDPYEQAMALRPNDIKARNNVTLAQEFARLGNLADHDRRAIEIAEETLKLTPAGSADWANTQNNLGNAWDDMPTGDRAENLKKAIDAYQNALTVYTKEAYPADWAMTQCNLGNALRHPASLPGAEAGACLLQAIASEKAALVIFTPEAYPEYHKTAESLLEACRKDYEASGAAATRPFDDIAPAP